MAGREDEEVYCICRGPDDGSLMIECNYCGEWFHTRCLSISQEALLALSEYKCEACKSSKVSAAKEEPGSKGRKRRKTEAPQPAKPDLVDATRHKVIDGLESALRPFMAAGFDAKQLCAQIEAALYQAHHQAEHVGQAYKAKYMSLLFNLKDPKNGHLRASLVDGSVTPDRLVRMSPAEMANEDLSQMIREAREQAVAQAVLEDEDRMSYVKKTHKGEEMVASYSSTPDITNSPLPAVPYALPLDAEEEEEEAELPRPAVDWNGLVLLQDVASFEAGGVAVGSKSVPSAILSQLPANLHISGRLAPSKALDYLGSIAGLPTRTIYAFRLAADPVVGPLRNTKADPEKLVGYLVDSDRWAVTSIDTSGSLRDLYLMPMQHMETYRSELESLGFLSKAFLGGPTGSFLAILVVSQK